MRAREEPLVDELEDQLLQVAQEHFPLPGISDEVRRRVYVLQLVDSIRRVRYVSAIANRDIHPDRGNPQSEMFDPVKAAWDIGAIIGWVVLAWVMAVFAVSALVFHSFEKPVSDLRERFTKRVQAGPFSRGEV